jgi:hypothetical protein
MRYEIVLRGMNQPFFDHGLCCSMRAYVCMYVCMELNESQMQINMKSTEVQQ